MNNDFATKITTNVLVNQLNKLLKKEDFELYYIDEYHHYYNDREFELEYMLLYKDKGILKYSKKFNANDLDFIIMDFDKIKKELEDSFNELLFREILYSKPNADYILDLNSNNILTIGNVLFEFNKIKTNSNFLNDDTDENL